MLVVAVLGCDEFGGQGHHFALTRLDQHRGKGGVAVHRVPRMAAL